MSRTYALLIASTALFTATSLQAASRQISGVTNGLAWEAKSLIIGQTSTATVAGGGNPIYFASMPKYSGVVSLIMDFEAGSFICSGTLMSDRRSIATAAHCVTDANLGKPLKTTAYFYGGDDPDTVVPFNVASTAIEVGVHFIHPEYTGEVIDQNDIAVLRLKTFAPDFAQGHKLYTPGDLTGQNFNVAGYGGRSDTGGAVGVNLGTGRLRQGDNMFDYAWGDPVFGGFFTEIIAGENFFGTAAIDHSYVSDFDNGLLANDSACQIAFAVSGVAGLGFCDPGVGALEVGTAGGDSGGPQFINGKLAAVTSYGLTFGSPFGDVDDKLNSSWGEFSGYVPIYLHKDFIQSVIPEPATWGLMISGFGVVGTAMRRKRKLITA